MKTRSPITLNPFQCRSESLPDNIVLMVKLIVIGLLMKDYVHDLSDHFLPFWPVFDLLGSPAAFKHMLQFLFITGSLGVLFTRWIRQSCFILALVFLTSVLSSKVDYTNVKFFCGCLFFLTSISDSKNPLVFLRFQMAVVYLGAAVNKVFDPDWRSGQYFEYWMSSIIKRDVYVTAASLLPNMVLSKIMCWLSILTEAFLSIGFLLRPLNSLAILVGVYFHSMVFLLASYDFRVFTIAILSSYLILVRWPQELTIRYDANKLFHRFLKGIVQLIDWDHRTEWNQAKGGLQVDTQTDTFNGFLAFKRLILYLPFSYFLFVLILGLPNAPYLWIKLKTLQFALVFFLPWPEFLHFLKTRKTK